MDAATILGNVRALSDQFAGERMARQRRRELDPADFARLHEAGFLLTGVPAGQGGIWESIPRSTRTIAEILRTLAHGDASVALVCAMHPTVLAFWLATPEVDGALQPGWDEQRRWLGESARSAQWGTITSEPGSGGDINQTKMTAGRATDTTYRVSGQKHFASGSGITSYMIATAVPEGETEPDLFFLDVQGVAWDGSSGMTLTAPWDGHGMIATQSHGFLFTDFAATRVAWPGHLPQLMAAVSPFIGSCFTAVIVGIIEVAFATARQQLERRRSSLRAYERVEWTRAELDAWLIRQAYEGMLRAIEETSQPAYAVLQGKTAVAELAGSAMERLCRVMGGGTYARYSPFGFWAQDVRALGFLRPLFGLAYDTLFDGSWAAGPEPNAP